MCYRTRHWWVVGGWAIEAFTGVARRHEDIDLVIWARDLPLLRAVSTEAMRKKPGRTEYQRGIVSQGDDGRWQVQITGAQGSGNLRSMSQANGMVVLHHAQGNVAAGDLVDVVPFNGLI